MVLVQVYINFLIPYVNEEDEDLNFKLATISAPYVTLRT